MRDRDRGGTRGGDRDGGRGGRGDRDHDGDRHYHHPRHDHDHDRYYYDFYGFFNPFFYGFWGFNYGNYCAYPDCYTSPYYYYGFPYVYAPRVEVVEVPTYTYTEVPPSYYDYYLSPGYSSGLTAALDDIRNAWTTGNDALITSHIALGTKIAVYTDGKYSYSLSGNDYLNMTRDAVKNVQTSNFSFYDVERRSDGGYTAFGQHEFTDLQGNYKVVYVSYTLQQINNRWIIVAAGSSSTRLR